MTWVESRYFADWREYPSDMAIKASEVAIKNGGIVWTDIELLIFASASQDITEPATANIIQKGLWLSCPVFDVKNACNSFLNWIDIADSFIKSWKYKNILICSGEWPSRAIKYDVSGKEEFKHYFAGYTFGDAGAAMILSATTENKWIQWRYFYSDGSEWDLATIMWWWVRYPRDPEKSYFCGNPAKIRDKFVSLDFKEFFDGLHELWRKKEDLKKVFVHQVSMSNFDYMTRSLKMEKDKFAIILPEVWNIASCCIPLSVWKYLQNNEVSPWDKVALIWFASGFSYGIMFYEF